MFKIAHPIKLTLDAIRSPNLCDRFDADDLKNIGILCSDGFTQDEQSRAGWMKRNENGMDLALQIQKDKTFPWSGSANVAFPIVTIAAMQFHARAYPALVPPSDAVKVAVFGPDPNGQRAARAERVSTHMSWQLAYGDRAWEDQQDKCLLNLSIVGTNFKKSYYSDELGHNVSELVLAKNFVTSYWTKSLSKSPRYTHIIPMFRNEVYEKVRRGTYVDVLDEPWYQAPPQPRITEPSTRADNRQGVTPSGPPDEMTPFTFLEQHCSLDLDGDGYAEPYIVTLEMTSKTVVRIVTRFDREEDIERVAAGPNKGKIIRIKATEYFTKYTFIPSPDGGFYDVGFGVFLGPMNESVNSIINMLLDAGTLQVTAGGFLGRGAKIRGGTYTFAPFEWKRIDSTGDDLRKSIYQLPTNAPSEVLFNLLSLLINYSNRVAATNDIMVGENPGQNTPAQTTQTMVEMGQKIYSAIFKRVWRAEKEEFEKLYRLNSIFLQPTRIYPGGATINDYQWPSDDLQPVADPAATSETQQIQRALTVKQAAMQTPGYNKDLVERQFLKSLKVPDIDAIFPGTEGKPPPPSEKVQIAQIKEQGAMQRHQSELQLRMQEFAATLQVTRELNNAKIVELQAKALAEQANAQSEGAYAQVAVINAEISRMKQENDRIDAYVTQMLNAMQLEADTELRRKELEKKSVASSD